MARKADPSNFGDYLNKVQKLTTMSRHNLPIPDHKETFSELVAEGNRLLEEEAKEKKTSETKRLESTLGSTSKNPYIRARIEILTKMDKTQLKLIEQMEAGKLPKDRRYDEFVKQVVALGDKMSE